MGNRHPPRRPGRLPLLRKTRAGASGRRRLPWYAERRGEGARFRRPRWRKGPWGTVARPGGPDRLPRFAEDETGKRAALPRAASGGCPFCGRRGLGRAFAGDCLGMRKGVAKARASGGLGGERGRGEPSPAQTARAVAPFAEGKGWGEPSPGQRVPGGCSGLRKAERRRAFCGLKRKGAGASGPGGFLAWREGRSALALDLWGRGVRERREKKGRAAGPSRRRAPRRCIAIPGPFPGRPDTAARLPPPGAARAFPSPGPRPGFPRPDGR